ncbi:MAG: hypothetical protein ACRDPY_11600 [Streptosporangiaceae bacterium]
MSTLTGTRQHGGARPIDLAWLTWRQHRGAITASVVFAAALTGSMAYLATRFGTINQQCGHTICASDTPQSATLHGTFGLSQLSATLTLAVVFAPLLVGVFLGVPLLAREHEQRTLLLAWSQDITPQRWLWTKLAVLAALTAALGAVVSVTSSHLADEVSTATGQSLFSGTAFLVTGMLPLVSSVVWLAVGVALGAAFRRTLPAAFAALAGYIGLYFLIQWRYPTFMTPLETTVPVGSGQFGTNALTVGQGSGILVNASGHHLSPAALQSLCSANNGALQSGLCLAQHHIRQTLRYQPASRIPEFHLILIGGYLGLGAVALATVWWLVRRTSLSAG